MTTSISDPREAIRRKAAELGFDICGFADVSAPWPAGARLQAFVEAGQLRRHEKTHTDAKPFKCEIEPCTFSTNRWSPSSTTRPVSTRPSVVATVRAW